MKILKGNWRSSRKVGRWNICLISFDWRQLLQMEKLIIPNCRQRSGPGCWELLSTIKHDAVGIRFMKDMLRGMCTSHYLRCQHQQCDQADQHHLLAEVEFLQSTFHGSHTTKWIDIEPNKKFVNSFLQPLLERNPLLFWKGLSGLLAAACFFSVISARQIMMWIG